VSLHLIKLCVGIDSVNHLADWQRARMAQSRAGEGDDAAGGGAARRLAHVTRHRPRRAHELLAGGSLYWVIKGVIRVRQRLLAIEPFDVDGQVRCALILDPHLVRTVARPHRAFQGWRYLEASDAPGDCPPGGEDDAMPADMLRALERLGVLV